MVEDPRDPRADEGSDPLADGSGAGDLDDVGEDTVDLPIEETEGE